MEQRGMNVLVVIAHDKKTDSPVHCEEGWDVIISEQQKSGQPAFQETTVSMETCNKNTKNESFLRLSLSHYRHTI